MLLHNYLLPRNCPRVTYYAKPESSQLDKETFLGTSVKFVVAVEKSWLPVIERTILYCYEFNANTFTLLDACAGYYISYKPVSPVAITRIDNPLNELSKRKDVELRVLPTLLDLADSILKSSLNFSLIRMINARPKEQ